MHFFMKNKIKLHGPYYRVVQKSVKTVWLRAGGVSSGSVKNVRKTENSKNRDSTLDSSLMSVKKIYIVI